MHWDMHCYLFFCGILGIIEFVACTQECLFFWCVKNIVVAASDSA